MTPGAAQALGALVCFGLADAVYKRAAAAGVRAHHFLAVQAWCFAPVMFAYAFATGALAPSRGMLWGFAAGFLMWTALYNFARSLADGAVSTNAAVFRLSFVLTAALAVLLLGEPLGAARLGGLAAALAAVWLLLGARAPGERRGRRSGAASLARVLLATGAMALVNLFYKLGTLTGTSPAGVLVAQASIFMPLATGYAAWIDRGLRPDAAAWRHSPLAALLLFFATLLLVSGLARGPASVLVPIAQMSFIVTAALGVAAFGEPLTGRKAAGLTCALAALALLALG